MKKGYTNKRIIKDGENFYGISFGFDFTSEHEWGIDEMFDKLGMNKNKLGVERRRINNLNNVVLKEFDDVLCLTSKTELTELNYLPSSLKISYDNKFEAAWDSIDFGISTNNEEYKKYFKLLYEEIKNNNVMIGTPGIFDINGFSEASSLSLLIINKLPEEVLNEFYFIDKKDIDLKKYEEKIGLTKLKKKKRGNYGEPKHYYACSPYWLDYNNENGILDEKKQKLNTKYNIWYWVNCSDGESHYGYHTVEEIKEWLNSKNLKLSEIKKRNNA